MRRKTWIIAVILVMLGGGLAGGLYWRWANSPRYALQQAALALQTRNMDKFFNYVDIKEAFNNFVEASSRDLNTPDDQQADELTKFSQRLGRTLFRFLPKLVDSFEPQIRSVLERYLLNLSNSQIMGIAAAATVAQIDTQGDAAQVTLIDPKSKEQFRFNLRRQPNHGNWQIVSVNYDDLKKFYKREMRR